MQSSAASIWILKSIQASRSQYEVFCILAWIPHTMLRKKGPGISYTESRVHVFGTKRFFEPGSCQCLTDATHRSTLTGQFVNLDVAFHFPANLNSLASSLKELDSQRD